MTQPTRRNRAPTTRSPRAPNPQARPPGPQPLTSGYRPLTPDPVPRAPGPRLSALPSPNPENSRSVDQSLPPRWQRILARIDECRALLARQGAIVASWRVYRGQRLGPYYRLAYRAHGQQRSIYLGNCLGLVERVREALENIQGRMRETRLVRRLIEQAKEDLAECKVELRRRLARVGIVMKGHEMRGVRAACARGFRPLVSPLVENPAVPPPPPMFGVTMRSGFRAWLWQTINERAMANEAAGVQ